MQVADEAGVKDGDGAEDEDCWEGGVSPDFVGAGHLWVAVAVDEHGGGGERVEEPFGEDGEFEELLETA